MSIFIRTYTDPVIVYNASIHNYFPAVSGDVYYWQLSFVRRATLTNPTTRSAVFDELNLDERTLDAGVGPLSLSDAMYHVGPLTLQLNSTTLLKS